jgi:hypothetical protein
MNVQMSIKNQLPLEKYFGHRRICSESSSHKSGAIFHLRQPLSGWICHDAVHVRTRSNPDCPGHPSEYRFFQTDFLRAQPGIGFAPQGQILLHRL